jgi:hypothetical protein
MTDIVAQLTIEADAVVIRPGGTVGEPVQPALFEEDSL